MKYLDERIIFTFSGQTLQTHPTGTYTYYLKRYVGSGNTTENVFAGSFYYNGTDTEINLDVTDIIASDGSVIKEDDFPTAYQTTWQRKSIQNKLVNKYCITIDWGNSSYTTSSNLWVAKVYRYPNKHMGEYRCFFEPNDYNVIAVRILEQGFNYSQTADSQFIPHYPMFSEEQAQEENDCPFGLSFLVGNNISAVTGSFRIGEDYRTDFSIPASGNSFSFLSRVGWVGAYRDVVPTTDGTLYVVREGTPNAIMVAEWGDAEYYGTEIFVRYPAGDGTSLLPDVYPYAYAYVENSNNKSISQVDITDIDTDYLIYDKVENPVLGADDLWDGDDNYTINAIYYGTHEEYKAAIFDSCPKRYYLFWQDRFGSFQCQGFNEYATYSEKFDRTEVQDYQNRRRNANIQVQSKWKLNSGWITEEQFPYYESIYTSPILMLYDSYLDKRFTVMVSSDYEEKTYRNQKKLINMNLELTENKKQNILY